MAAIDHLHARGRKRSDWTPVTTGSVDAAEHVAKAILTGYGLSPREVHFLDALAEQLATAYRGRNDPRQAEWAERVRAMNGTTRTRRLHDADYRRFVAPPAEPLERRRRAHRAGSTHPDPVASRDGRALARARGGDHGCNARDRRQGRRAFGLARELREQGGDRGRAYPARRSPRWKASTAEWIGSAKAQLAGLDEGGEPPSGSAGGEAPVGR